MKMFAPVKSGFITSRQLNAKIVAIYLLLRSDSLANLARNGHSFSVRLPMAFGE